MEFRCEDLAQAGVVLILRDSAEFGPHLEEVKRVILNPPPGSPPSRNEEAPELPYEDDPGGAILWNRSEKPLCAFTLVWTYRWNFEGQDRESSSTHRLGASHSPSLLEPFGLKSERRPFEIYWKTILPGSRRWVADGKVLGSNADVRPPSPEEEWKGGVMRFFGGGGMKRRGAYAIRLRLDAAFFATGECAGEDLHQLRDRVVARSTMKLEAAQIARRGMESGKPLEDVLSEIELLTGPASEEFRPPPPPPPGARVDPVRLRDDAGQDLANAVARMRMYQGDERAVAMLSEWADADVPEYRRI